MPENSYIRDFGSLEARVKNLEKMQGEIRRDVRDIKTCLDRYKGGRLALGGLLGAAGTLGALFTQLIHWFAGKGG